MYFSNTHYLSITGFQLQLLSFKRAIEKTDKCKLSTEQPNTYGVKSKLEELRGYKAVAVITHTFDLLLLPMDSID